MRVFLFALLLCIANVSFAAVPYVTPEDYGAVGDGLVNDTTAIANAISAAATAKQGVMFGYGKTYVTGPITISGSNVPTFIDLNKATLKVLPASTGAFVTIENAHSAGSNFRFGGGTIDAGTITGPGLYVHGLQHAHIHDLEVKNSNATGVRVYGDAGYGVYYNTFENVYAHDNADSGFAVKSDPVAATNRVNSNTFENCSSQYNGGYGWSIDYSNNTYVGCSAEQNPSHEGWNLAHCQANDIVGGYTENNSSTDYSIFSTSTCSGTKVFGGKHNGTIGGTGITRY